MSLVFVNVVKFVNIVSMRRRCCDVYWDWDVTNLTESLTYIMIKKKPKSNILKQTQSWN